jgi:hypothetical protein
VLTIGGKKKGRIHVFDLAKIVAIDRKLFVKCGDI